MTKDYLVERRVIVWGEPQMITVHRKSKSVYEAVGDYMGATIRVKDQSEGAAINRWHEAAKSKGNG